MGRKSGNITMQLNKRIDDLLRIGEKKVKDDPTNSNRVEGIHSVQMNIPVAGYRQSGEMETVVPALWEPLPRTRACSGC